MNRRERILEQGKAVVRAIEALETIEATRPIRHVTSWLLLKAYRRRLRAILPSAPGRVSEEIMCASERIGEERAVLWMSKQVNAFNAPREGTNHGS